MQLYLALFLVGLCLWESCIAICPDGNSSPLRCNPTLPFVCPEGYTCWGTIISGECCLEPGYRCRIGVPYNYGDPNGLYRCDGKLPNSGICPRGHVCKGVEPTNTKIGVCCRRLFPL